MRKRNSKRTEIGGIVVDYLSQNGLTKRKEILDIIYIKTGSHIDPSNLNRELRFLKSIGVVEAARKLGYYVLAYNGLKNWNHYLQEESMVFSEVDVDMEKQSFASYIDDSLSPSPGLGKHAMVAEPRHPYRADGFTVRDVILGCGLTMEQLHNLSGVPLSMLSDWRDGVNPPFYVTEMLRNMVSMAEKHPDLIEGRLDRTDIPPE